MFWIGFIIGSAMTFMGLVTYSCLVASSRMNQKLEEENMQPSMNDLMIK